MEKVIGSLCRGPGNRAFGHCHCMGTVKDRAAGCRDHCGKARNERHDHYLLAIPETMVILGFVIATMILFTVK